MIGVFSYTVWLTYLSLISACLGIAFSLNQSGCPYIGVFFLLFCGLCDAFDGKVASSKKNRNTFEKKFGIQIDSLADLVAFGVLPMSIGLAVYRSSSFINDFVLLSSTVWYAFLFRILVFGIFLFYALAAITSSALIFPSLLLLNYLTSLDLSLLYFGGLFVTGFLFLLKFQIKKLDTKGILILVGIGVLEVLLLLMVKIF